MQTTRTERTGFTLFEVLIVVAILLILAGMAVPAFQDTVDDARATSTRQELQRVRTAIDYYSFQHQEQLPGWNGGSWDEVTLRNQLLMASDLGGITAAPGTSGYAYGPYLTEGVPANPYNDLESILIIAPGGSMATANDSTGWVYFAADGSFRANSTAVTPGGDPVFGL
ncbi:MAG: prepilin-type N-terminal cleavage/methylation domain-containing protein [Planctomycetes bacterium]|nr:prepilin-type N-terminal cleavage/methylation domain-containing protein [Planctomycetota bacterium]MBL7007597.1 prepilin-type N-terminal cleavage/methylation domain-containing protein [Planctomycetota bacterium]